MTITHQRQGHLYEATRHLPLKEVTALIRKEARETVAKWNAKNPTIGEVKISVRMSHHHAIDADLKVDGLVHTLHKEFGEIAYAQRLRERVEDIESLGERFVPLVKLYELRDAIEEIRAKYNYNDSDPMTDYFSVRYYGSTTIRNKFGGYA
jgi:hypothetical protein